MERLASRAALDNFSPPVGRSIAEIHAAIDSLGDVTAVLKGKAPKRLEELYDEIDVQVCYKQTPRG